jgi:pimeloyl-ACP methyl ester carboxylesterase
VKTTGDGVLAEFSSAQEAVSCAVSIQTAMSDREAVTPEDRRICYRLGINLGDVVFDDGDIFGDGVNVAARLEGLARPGSVCISDIVHQAVADRIRLPFRDMGSQRVKNISRPIRVWQWSPDAPPQTMEPGEAAVQQRVQFATAPDGVQIAWASIGEGAPVLKAPNWMNHLEYEWQSPVWHALFARLGRMCRLVRFDQRGNGLSDWDVEAISEGAMAGDMATVAAAAGLSRFALFGMSQGCSFSIRYATAHPDQVTCLVLLGGFLRGRNKRPNPDQRHLYEVGSMMIRDGWGSTNPVFRHFFTTNFMPDAPPEIAASFDELQRMATSPAAALRLWTMNSQVDVTDLAKTIAVPTLVLHCVGDRVAPIEEGRFMAKCIPDATFVELPGNNHLLLEGTPAFGGFLEECSSFLAAHNR